MATKEIGLFLGFMISILFWIYGLMMNETNENLTYLMWVFIGLSANTIMFFYHDLIKLHNYLLYIFLKKFGVKTESKKRKLCRANRNATHKTANIELKLEERLHVKANLDNGAKREFISQLIWLPLDWNDKIWGHGASVIDAPKKVSVYYLKSIPSIYHVDLSFVDKQFLLPKKVSYTLKYLAIIMPPVMLVIYKSIELHGPIF